MALSKVKQVAVIGAGASGLVAAKSLLEAGLEPTVFEQAAGLGGIWTFDEAVPDGGSPAYRSLQTNTPKQITAFSDYPFNDELPDFPAAAAVVSYLDGYATRFNLRSRIQFNTVVERLEPADAGRWNVTVTRDGKSETRPFDAVLVCSGMFHEPLLPTLPGLDSFGGKVLHSRYYADPAPFAGQRVLVVGVGSSGVDIAVECGGVARVVFLSGRNNTWTPNAGAPMPRPGSGPRQRLARNLRLSLGLGTRHPCVPPDAPFVLWRDRLIMNDKLRATLASGAVAPRPDLTHIAGKTVRFEDGTSAEVDAIVCATGYALCFPFLDEAIFRVTPDGLGLYRAIFHPDYPTLGVIGMSRATGAIMPLAEIQSRWAATVLRGDVRLPAPAVQHAQIAARREEVVRKGGNPFRIEFEPYADTLAAEIGVLPRLWRHPLLVRELLWGKPIAARYRLDGSHRSPDAARTIRTGNRVDRQPGTPPARSAWRRAFSRG